MANKRGSSGRTAATTKRPPGAPGTDGRRPTKAERKEEARRQRLEIQRRMSQRRRNRWIATAVAVVVIAGSIAFVMLRSTPEPPNPKPQTLPGMLTGPAPWSANTADLSARLDRLNLPPVGGTIHIHAHLDLFVNGKSVPVPPSVGISEEAGAPLHGPLHTHDDTGVIHIESDQPYDFTLGQLFDVWGVRFTTACVGGYCASGGDQLRAYVDGKPYAGDPTGLVLANEQELVVTFGTDAQLPDPIPATYDWSTLVA